MKPSGHGAHACLLLAAAMVTTSEPSPPGALVVTGKAQEPVSTLRAEWRKDHSTEWPTACRTTRPTLTATTATHTSPRSLHL